MTSTPSYNQATAQSAAVRDRVIAGLIDLVVGGALVAGLGLLLGLAIPQAFIAWPVAVAAVLVPRELVLALTGWSPGGRVMGVRLVDATTGGPPRTRLFIHADLLCVTVGLGAIVFMRSASIDPRGQGWHDRMAGTLAVTMRSRPAGRPAARRRRPLRPSGTTPRCPPSGRLRSASPSGISRRRPSPLSMRPRERLRGPTPTSSPTTHSSSTPMTPTPRRTSAPPSIRPAQWSCLRLPTAPSSTPCPGRPSPHSSTPRPRTTRHSRRYQTCQSRCPPPQSPLPPPTRFPPPRPHRLSPHLPSRPPRHPRPPQRSRRLPYPRQPLRLRNSRPRRPRPPRTRHPHHPCRVLFRHPRPPRTPRPHLPSRPPRHPQRPQQLPYPRHPR